MTTQTHITKFQKNTRTKRYYWQCTCGRFGSHDTLEECQSRAATHDIEWEDIDPAQMQPAPVSA